MTSLPGNSKRKVLGTLSNPNLDLHPSFQGKLSHSNDISRDAKSNLSDNSYSSKLSQNLKSALKGPENLEPSIQTTQFTKDSSQVFPQKAIFSQQSRKPLGDLPFRAATPNEKSKTGNLFHTPHKGGEVPIKPVTPQEILNDHVRREQKRMSMGTEAEYKFGESYVIDENNLIEDDYVNKVSHFLKKVNFKKEMTNFDVRFGLDLNETKEEYEAEQVANFYEEFKIDLAPYQSKILGYYI